MEQNYELYKYFKGEKQSPFDHQKEKNKDFFWYIESMHFKNSKHGNNFHSGLVDSLRGYIEYNKNEENILTDESISIDKRALIYYIDLMIGKWLPYRDSFIDEYWIWIHHFCYEMNQTPATALFGVGGRGLAWEKHLIRILEKQPWACGG